MVRLSKGKFIFFLVIMLFAFLAVLPVAEARKNVVIQSPPVISALPLLWMEERGVLEKAELEINLSPDHKRAIALISRGDIDMMVTGVNVGAKVYNKGIDISLLNTNVWGIDYLLTNGFKANNWKDLKGKTLSLPLKGGPLDFLARYFLNAEGIDIKEVNLVYRPITNGAQYFQAGKLDAIILPEPLVTVTLAKTKEAQLSLDIQKEWAKLNNGDSRIPFIGLFVNGKFARNNPELVRQINSYYKEGIDWVNENPDEAASLASKYFNMPAGVIKSALKRIKFSYYSKQESISLIENYFNEILKIYPEMIGGSLPDEKFYH